MRRRQIAGSLEEWHASAFEHALEQFDAAARRLQAHRQSDRDDQAAAAHDRGAAARAHGRRHDPQLPRVSRAAQHGARPGEGRHPLPSGRHGRRGQGARVLDDVQVRRRRHPDGRREGRRHRRSAHAVAGRARAAVAPLHGRDDRSVRARQRRARPRRQHGPASHGLDARHLRHAQARLPAGRHHGQADGARRLGAAGRARRRAGSSAACTKPRRAWA